MKRWLIGVLVVLLGCGGWVVHQNTYDLREERVSIGDLRGVLALPESGDRHGLVVFVHGDGPVDATHETFYRPLWEAFARAGYASLSWDKPGVAGAPGNWLHQTMADRTREVLDAVAWAGTRPEIDPARIGLWGASQAGWVLPAAARHPGVKFLIAVSPAVNWHEQGRFNLLAELRERGAPAEEVDAALARREATLDHLRRRSTFEQYRAAVGATDLTPDRWRFILANHESDASADLAQVTVPVLLVLGGRDLNVDVADTEATYRRLVRRVEVARHPEGAHDLTPADRGAALTAVVAVAAPRSVFVDGYLDEQRRFLERVR
ncbi:alpha/beta hydrolase family protein [Saccharothrix algeriensis]|uniref:Alpha/beta hydrolase n=1 Tax=Saccharothrix algeriensis TaxID=173560 RepID=A0A8T8HZD5_9PSEU|nr:alpha/beta hydrolase [Saccharothrix algeriensis]MBM7809578.1 dienelactone hydrolase [Saccharothrix algeriensis]QTR03892.1 alpha/beta hydrolase [Saccharothrix algeriensis]